MFGRRKRGPSAPPAPVNVRLVRDGKEIPAELVFSGFRDGLAVWTAVSVPYLPGDVLRCDELPGRTVIAIGSPGMS
ncbi:hypothetical protein N806_20465 [Rhodococcus sp. P27]|nr:hypothetical protein N806_12190 [Rhodococcus sp. P27]ERB53515.1 hypothetical protein N806_20465 [Rhodococcus sp. P27]